MSENEMKDAIGIIYQGVLRELYHLGKFGVKLGLDNISSLLQVLDNPHQKFPSIHLAGSNGKGSTAAFLEAALRAAGYRVGLYTSPHLVDFRERIRVDGKPISQGDVVGFWRKTKPWVRRLKATYFEVVTAMAFEHFRSQQVEIAVVEVGLGGRLDATNVLLPHVVVITNISREHTRWLGTRLDKIAREKAGIIKEGTPVICAETRRTPLGVIRRVCSRKKANLHLVDEELHWEIEEVTFDGTDLLIKDDHGYYGSLYLGLAGRHQVRNAMTALLSLEVLRNIGWGIPMRAVRQGFSLVHWPGRMQVVRESPMILLDVAHNPAGTKALSAALQEFLPQEKICFIFGVQEEKEHRKMLRHLAPMAEKMLLTRAQWKSALDPKELAREAQKAGVPFQVKVRVRDAVLTALKHADPKDAICITGSHYVVGEAMEALGLRA
jgi:dihydrofolate synthase/folylpolyglutamate synthase